MTKKLIAAYYDQHNKLLHDLSHKCAFNSGKTEEEVYQQACLLFMEATKSYDPDRNAAFSTYLYRYVKNGLVTWGMHKTNDMPVSDENIPEQMDTAPDPRKALMMKEWLAGLSKECREIAGILLNGPAEVLDLVGTESPKAVRGALWNYLRYQKKWSRPAIWEAFTEMKRNLNML